MNNSEERKHRFLRDPLKVRLRGLAANLARISSFVQNDSNKIAVDGLIDETKHFIEWTAAEVTADNTEELVELQVTLARWQLSLDNNWSDSESRKRIGKLAKEFSARGIANSGLLDPN